MLAHHLGDEQLARRLDRPSREEIECHLSHHHTSDLAENLLQDGTTYSLGHVARPNMMRTR
jgi:hypothetical protein